MQKTEWNTATFTIRRDGGETVTVTFKGRVRWALENLIEAGSKGCTPILNPAPRLAAYVHKLRCNGLSIETVTEPHAGAFAGTHARYVLLDFVVRAD